METPILTFRCPDALLIAFDEVAKKKGMSRSDAVRLALIQFINKEGDKRE